MSKETNSIADFYGLGSQLLKLAEECTELGDVAFKSWKKSFKNKSDIDREHLAEEIADVKLVSEQISYLLELDERVSAYRKFKIKRQLSRIKKEQKQRVRRYGVTRIPEED